MKLDLKTGNPCSVKKDFCRNCHNHYSEIRPSVKGVYISNNFVKDFKDEDKARSMIEDVLKCSHIQFTELHKFEKHVDGFLVFRAKIDGDHIVYSIDKKEKVIIFLRMFKNYTKYKKFLEDDTMIKRTLARSMD